MLRVVKAGGSVITSNDSYSPDSMTEEEDARSWNDHPAVLMGINENRPTLGRFIDPLLDHRDILDVEFWTSSVWRLWSDELRDYEDFLEPKRWDLWTQHAALRQSAGGGIFMRVTPKAPVRHEPRSLTSPIVRPVQIASWIGNKTLAMAEIARLTPPEYMMPKFPGAAGNTKFQVLNGWRWTEPGEFGRQAYRCGRWYLTRRHDQPVMEIVVRPPVLAGALAVTLEIVVDGTVKTREGLTRGSPSHFEIDIAAVPVDKPFCVEARLVEKDLSLEHGSFQVEKLEALTKLTLEQKLNLALHEINRLNETLAVTVQQQLVARDQALDDLITRSKHMTPVRIVWRLILKMVSAFKR
jgi:hypothetical protein